MKMVTMKSIILIGILKTDAGKDTEMVKHLWQRRLQCLLFSRLEE